MSTEHTQGRVYLAPSNVIGCGDPQKWERLKINSPWVEDAWEGDAEAVANMRRLAACWNALIDLPQEALDGGWTRAGLEAHALKMERQAQQAQAQRDELLATLTRIRALPVHPDAIRMAHKHAEAAIAKVKGGAA